MQLVCSCKHEPCSSQVRGATHLTGQGLVAALSGVLAHAGASIRQPVAVAAASSAPVAAAGSALCVVQQAQLTTSSVCVFACHTVGGRPRSTPSLYGSTYRSGTQRQGVSSASASHKVAVKYPQGVHLVGSSIAWRLVQVRCVLYLPARCLQVAGDQCTRCPHTLYKVQNAARCPQGGPFGYRSS
jgi:hypothetical protein